MKNTSLHTLVPAFKRRGEKAALATYTVGKRQPLWFPDSGSILLTFSTQGQQNGWTRGPFRTQESFEARTFTPDELVKLPEHSREAENFLRDLAANWREESPGFAWRFFAWLPKRRVLLKVA